jgi:hypothetical protein
MPRMKALQSHGWKQGKVEAGDEYEATDQEAQLLSALGWAEPAGMNGNEPRQRRPYRRRDMSAQH